MRLRPSLLFVLFVTLLAACGNLSPAPNLDLAVTAVPGGEVVGWGDNGGGQTTAPSLPEGVTYTAISAGYFHSLGLRSDGQVEAWGSNALGQTTVPALPSGVTYTAVAAGGQHSLALRSDGQLVGWGNNDSGQTNIPALPEGVTYKLVAAADSYGLALRSDGQAIGWGINNSGQTDIPAPPSGVSYTAFAAGQSHALGLLSNGQVVGWGNSGDGRTTAPALPEGVTYTAISAGQFHSLGLRSDGQSVGWGFNSNGQTTVPALPEGVTYTAVASGPGSRFSAWLRSDGQVVARGENRDGQTDVPTPPEGKRYVAVAAGLGHGLGIVVPKEAQTITFTSTPPQPATVGGSYQVSAEASSGLPVTIMSSTTTVCTLSGSTVTFVAPGECVLSASQSGNGVYLAAEPVEQRFTVSALPVVTPDRYTIDLDTAPLNRILYSVKVGQGVTYSGIGTANKDAIRVDGFQYKNGKRFGGNQVKVVSVSGDKVLTVVQQGTNTPNPAGGELDIKPAPSFGGPSKGKNGLVTLKSITVDGISTNNAKLVLYGDGKAIKTLSLSKTPSQTLTLNEPNVGFIQVRANDSFTVDDVVFEVPAKQ